jgi:CheY-like chemotaxis protein
MPSQKKQQEITILIVDYKMPELNGLDLCRALKDLAIKKILLTGEGGNSEAVDAFNEKLIHHFIRKDSATLLEDIQASIEELSLYYFSEQSKPLLKHLETKYLLPVSDKIFQKHFLNWKAKNDIIEYYLIEKFGSFLCFNSKGETYYFITHTKDSLQYFLSLCEESHIIIPEEIKNAQKIPFFGEDKTPSPEGSTPF